MQSADRTLHVNAIVRIPVLVLVFVQHCRAEAHASVIDEDIDLTKLIGDRFDGFINVVGVGDIDQHRQRFAAVRLDLGYVGFNTFLRAFTPGKRNFRALLCKLYRYRLAEPLTLGCAGDDGNLSFECFAHDLSL